MSRKFAAFILTHGRANDVKTDKSLRKQGYTGDIYYIIDDEDEQEEEYYKNFGDKVIKFNKQKYMDDVDTMNPEAPRGVILYARNACFDIAEEMGLTHFLELDDDYCSWCWRYPREEGLRTKNIKNVDKVFEAMLDFLDASGAKSVALAQGGDYVGGVEGRWYQRILRKAMNSFFCRTDRRFKFFGAVNEDVNTYVSLGNKGQLFFTELLADLHQGGTQQTKGGMTEAYLDFGTYVKSFYTVMACPSCVKISVMGNKDMRIHHKIMWKNAVPKIINESWRK